MTKLEQILQECRKDLGSEILGQAGEFVNSSTESLKSGLLYVLAQNPGSIANEDDSRTVGDDIEALMNNAPNKYYSEVWGASRRTPLQERYIWLMNHLSELFPEIGDSAEIFVSNLAFVRRSNLKMPIAEYNTLISACWICHQRLLRIVRPRIIMTIGNNSNNSAFEYLYRKHRDLGGTEFYDETTSGHGGYELKVFRSELLMEGGQLSVIGLPHLARYKITQYPEAVVWVEKQVAKALDGET